MNIIFFDIDGVFCTSRIAISSISSDDLWVDFDPIAVNFF